MDDDILNTIFDSAIKNKNIIKNRQVLTIDYVPDKLLFRTKESTAIAQSLSVILKKGRPSNLLIFGKPGTGKTAVVKNVIEHLYKKTNELNINLKVPFINAKNSNTPYKILYEIAELLGINKEGKMQVYFTGLSMSEATDRILDFIRRRSIKVVIVIDEIDSLVNRKGDDILYNFTRANERISSDQFISLVGISNSLTFKDKLDPRVKSSLSEEELVFNPYTIEQLKQILIDRCKLAFYDNVIPIGVINLCAAIAGRETGDARKAIDLLRVAAEIAERSMTLKISEDHIRSAQQKIDSDTNYEILRNSTLHTKLVILSIIKSKNGSTGEIYTIYQYFCSKIEQEPLTQRRMTQIVGELDQLGLITTNIVNQGRYGRTQRIKLHIHISSVKQAIKNDPVLSPFIDNINN
ncbi:MAG: AAA family ATPase [Nitrososphaeraceae archaeon]|nr:AAA family ATPase [Nitrososphaeraceae archaeon]MDW0143202.1 AAA family ATPase [Nitrososphaeraceae archaeon]MDW0143952.1 AAA family ATPase [Nitrososphaeraceae archaeon]MDW3653797.1 AAA family ATPase [Nitrososphaeraceae archaeon]